MALLSILCKQLRKGRALLLLLTILLSPSLSHALTATCYYYPNTHPLTYNSCLKYKETFSLLNIPTTIVPISSLPHPGEIQILSGYGTPSGYFLTPSGSSILSWDSLLSLLLSTSPILIIIDSCYSGQVFLTKTFQKEVKPRNTPTIITSTNAESMSVNIPLSNTWYSSLSLTLHCILTHCSLCSHYSDPQVCQLEIIYSHQLSHTTFRYLHEYPHLHPNISIGTTLINSIPWRQF